MIFRASRRCKREELEKALLQDMGEQLQALPLERFCQRGGWPLEVRISRVEKVRDEGGFLEALLFVSFTETGAACCSGDIFEKVRFVELLLRIDKRDWSGSFPVEA